MINERCERSVDEIPPSNEVTFPYLLKLTNNLLSDWIASTTEANQLLLKDYSQLVMEVYKDERLHVMR